MSCCLRLCAVASRDRARPLVVLCWAFPVFGGFAKALLLVSSKTLTDAGRGGAGAASGAHGGSA
jgi:hypothetical protein